MRYLINLINFFAKVSTPGKENPVMLNTGRPHKSHKFDQGKPSSYIQVNDSFKPAVKSLVIFDKEIEKLQTWLHEGNNSENNKQSFENK